MLSDSFRCVYYFRTAAMQLLRLCLYLIEYILYSKVCMTAHFHSYSNGSGVCTSFEMS